MTDVTITIEVGANDHTFTFETAMIDSISSTITSDVTQTVMPGSGPAANIGNDFNGSNKMISITGILYSSETTVVTGTNAPQITSIKQMKYWLEALQNGLQTAKAFTSNYEDLSVESSSIPTAANVEGAIIPATLNVTKIYVTNFSFTEEEASPDKQPFSLSLYVAYI